MKNLRLDRPLVIFDLETTGTDVTRDRIVQIGLIRLEADGSRRTHEALINPQMPIPPAATAVHGITDAEVAHLAKMTNLESLVLSETAITDAAVDTLSKMTSLERLTLSQTGVSEEGMNTLRNSLPDCTIRTN